MISDGSVLSSAVFLVLDVFVGVVYSVGGFLGSLIVGVECDEACGRVSVDAGFIVGIFGSL